MLLVSKENILKENAALPDECFYWLPSENDRWIQYCDEFLDRKQAQGGAISAVLAAGEREEQWGLQAAAKSGSASDQAERELPASEQEEID